MIGYGKTYMKGVESDFIRVYQNRDADNSFAFIFDYIDKEPEDFRIHVSIKTGANQYFSSENISCNFYFSFLIVFVTRSISDNSFSSFWFFSSTTNIKLITSFIIN